MKKILLFAILLATSYSFSQVARVVQSKQKALAFSSGSLVINSQLHDFHLESSSQLQMVDVIQHNVFDSLGKVISIDYILLPYLSEKTQLTGVFQKNTSTVILYTVKREVGTINVQHDLIEINIATNTFIQNTELAIGNLAGNISNVVQIGNELVSYVRENNIGIKRLAVDMTNYSNFSTEFVDSLTVSPTHLYRRTLFFTIYNGVEYCSFSGTKKVYKRQSTNIYVPSIDIPNWLVGANTSIATNGSIILVSNSSEYTLLDMNLALLSQDSIGSLNPLANLACLFSNNHFYILSQKQGTETKLLKFDNAMIMVSEFFDNIDLQNTELRLLNNKLAFSSTLNANLFTDLLENGLPNLAASNTITNTVTAWVSESQLNEGFLDFGYKLKSNQYFINSGFAHEIVTKDNADLYGGYSNAGQNLIFSATNLISGLEGSNIVGTKNAGAKNSFLIGPYTDSNAYDLRLQSDYSRKYFVSKFSIANHLQQLANGTPNYIPEFAIREWPGNGDVSKGQAAILAAFHDENSNGFYEPMLGDYPSIYGDECVFAISHTSEGTTNSPKIELHSYRFKFHCDSNEVVTNTIFQKNIFISRGANLNQVFLGNYFDFDLGFSQDDYMGTNIELGMIYSFNATTFDGSIGNSSFYGSAPPAFGVMTLHGAKLPNDGVDNVFGVGTNESINGTGFGDGVIDNEFSGLYSSFGFDNPSSTSNLTHDFFNIMLGNNADGSSQIAPNGTVVRHVLFGSTDPLFYSSGGIDHGNNWSEETAMNPAGDRRIFGATGPGTMNIGDTLSSLIALIYSRDTNATTIQEPVAKLFADATSLKTLVTNGDLGCGQNFEPIVVSLGIEEKVIDNIKIYPNPTKEKFAITGMEGKTEILLFDMNGRVLFSTSSEKPTVEIDLSNFSEGMYFVQLSSEKGSALKKVIRN